MNNTNHESRYYILRGCDSLWGDYGSILINGMCDYAQDETVILRRTGPFIPPISFPGGFGEFVITDSLKRDLDISGLVGLTFHKVIKELIVESNWETWDWNASNPAIYPSGGPEYYVMEKSHSSELAMRLGVIWEARSARLVECISLPGTDDGPLPVAITTEPKLFGGIDFFRTTHKSGLVFISHRAKNWLTQKVPKWVSFDSVSLVD